MQTPGSVSPKSPRLSRDADEIRYDEPHILRPVRRNGTIRWSSKEVFVTDVLRPERVGLLAASADEVYFGGLYLGMLGGETFNPNLGVGSDK